MPPPPAPPLAPAPPAPSPTVTPPPTSLSAAWLDCGGAPPGRHHPTPPSSNTSSSDSDASTLPQYLQGMDVTPACLPADALSKPPRPTPLLPTTPGDSPPHGAFPSGGFAGSHWANVLPSPQARSFPAASTAARGAVVVFVQGNYLETLPRRGIFELARAMGIRVFSVGGPGRLPRVVGGAHLGRWTLGPVSSEDVNWVRQMEHEGLIEKFLPVAFDDGEQAFQDALLAIRELAAQTGRLDCVTSFCEVTVLLATRLAEALGLPCNPSTAVIAARDKREMRLALQRAGLPTARHAALGPPSAPGLAAAAVHVGFPAVLKPVSGVASIGVVRVDNVQELGVEYLRVVGAMRRLVDASSAASSPHARASPPATPLKAAGPTTLAAASAATTVAAAGGGGVAASALAALSAAAAYLTSAVWAAKADVAAVAAVEAAAADVPAGKHVAEAAFPGALSLTATASGGGGGAFEDTNWMDLSLMLEEYMPGAEVDCDIVMSSGRAIFGSVTDNWAPLEPDFNETGGNCPSLLPDAQQQELLQLAERALQVLGFTMGTHHVECKWTPQGARVIEINCRMGGAYTRLVNQLVWGVDLAEQHLLSVIGRSPTFLPPRVPLTAVATQVVHARCSGTLEHVDFLGAWPLHPDVTYIVPRVSAGQWCTCAADGIPTWVYDVMVTRPTPKEAIELVNKMESLIAVPLLTRLT